MSQFNLVDDPWIPVRWKPETAGGAPPLVSLRDAFALGDRIADLSAAPHERVSVMRLLVCVAQAACGAPENPDGWGEWGCDLSEAVPLYLNRWRDRFNLFGDGHRFLQVRLQRKPEPVPVSKLIPNFATGNNPTLNDHHGGEFRPLPPHRLAMALLSFQSFYPLYGAGYKGRGPCVDSNMVHTLLIGEHLPRTVVLNSLDHETINDHFPEFGRPVWELDRDDTATERQVTLSYLGRLVPRHRNLMLSDDGSGFDLVQQGFEYPAYEAAIEPTATVCLGRKAGKDAKVLLSARLGRALWRDLHLVVALAEASKDGRRAPLLIQSHEHDIGDERVSFWLGALVTDLKAKILDTVESDFTIPRGFLSLLGQKRYGDGVLFAEEVSRRVYGAVKTYSATLKHESAPVEAAQRHYWNALDRDSRILLGMLDGIGTAGDPMGHWGFGERHDDGSSDRWTTAIRQAARDAYEHACPHLTPRQLQAYAAGLRVLHPSPKKAAAKAVVQTTAKP